MLGLLNEGRVVPFLGAGCSMEADSNLPSATVLAELLISRGHGQPEETLEDIAERLVSSGGWQRFAAALPRADWRVAPCNEAHLVLAELCREGLIRRVLTTNWDTLVEAALRDVQLGYAPIVHAGALATEPADTVAVIKLHGCIDHPEYLKATRSEIESPTWAEDWAAALFEILVRSYSILFVGYSGSARAATHTIAKIVRAGERQATDYLVDVRPYADLRADGVAGPFVEAIALTHERALQCSATEFFRRLRNAIYPLLLERPMTEARSLLDALCSPTNINGSDVQQTLTVLRQHWTEVSPMTAQDWLRSAFLVFPECRPTRSYVSLIQRKNEIGRCWAWMVIGAWAGVLRLESMESLEPEAEVLLNGSTANFPCLITVCPSSGRRDSVAHQVTKTLMATSAAPITAYIGVLFGGVGPDPDATRDFSVARGPRRASVARPGSVVISWTDGDRLFEFFEPAAEAPDVRERIQEEFRQIASRLVQTQETE